MVKFLIRLLLVIPLIVSCASVDENNSIQKLPNKKDERKYSFYVGQEKTWLSLDEVKVAIKNSGGNMRHDMLEVTAFPNIPPTDEQNKASVLLKKQAIEAVLKNNWFSYKQAIADGYVRLSDEREVHYYKPEYLTDGEVLNPEKPEFLMFYNTEKGMLMAGVMFLMENHEDHGPQPGGNNMLWHFHWISETCWKGGVAIEHAMGGVCPEGQYKHDRSPEMLHLWIAENPNGIYASDMFIVAEHLVNDPLIVDNSDK